MNRILLIAGLLIALTLTASADRRRLMMARPAASSAPTPDILWWKCNDGSGTTVTGDGTNGGDDGTMDGTWATGKSGSLFSMDFNGTTGDAATDSSITYGVNKITVAFWAYPDTSDASTRVYLESSASANANADCFIIYSDTSGFHASVRGTTGFREETITKPASGAWVHILMVLDNSSETGDVVIYKDGVLQSESVTSTTKTGTSNFAAYVLYAASRNRGGAFFYDGKLDDIRIYSTDQSANVTAIMNDAQ